MLLLKSLETSTSHSKEGDAEGMRAKGQNGSEKILPNRKALSRPP